jgi:hypothetical protein
MRRLRRGEEHEPVMRGLDPRIHLLRENFLRRSMDCRVKPGNDGVEGDPRNLLDYAFYSHELLGRGIARHYNRHACRSNRSLFSIVLYNEFCNSRGSAPVNRRNPLTAMWLGAPMRRPPVCARVTHGVCSRDVDQQGIQPLSSPRKYIAGESRNVSRAQRSTKWCAADTDLGFTRDRRSNVRKSGKPDLRGPPGSVAVPDQRRTAPLRFALHRIRDTQ